MHQSSLNNMKKMLDTILTKEFTNQPRKILDYGGRRIDGHDSYFSLLKDIPNLTYVSVDIEAGEGVDLVMSDPYRCQLDDQTVDIIITGQMFEHCEFFWLTIQDMARLLRPGGYVCAITPSAGPVHRYPVDCWRFYPDSYSALAKWAKLELVDSWHDLSGKWCDQVGLLRKPL